jgi:glycosyltransferase involved in cell wall biosynthesis
MAFNEYLKKTTNPQKLLLLGCKDADLKVMLNNMEAMDLYEHIIITGYVSDEDLPVLYQMSQLFLFPSLREGFGIPIIEAMACGVPVITSNTSSMPEVAGDAGHLIDPNKTDDIYKGMLKIMSDHTYKNELIQRGLKRSKQFSWNKMASQVLEQYEQLYKEIKT